MRKTLLALLALLAAGPALAYDTQICRHADAASWVSTSTVSKVTLTGDNTKYPVMRCADGDDPCNFTLPIAIPKAATAMTGWEATVAYEAAGTGVCGWFVTIVGYPGGIATSKDAVDWYAYNSELAKTTSSSAHTTRLPYYTDPATTMSVYRYDNLGTVCGAAECDDAEGFIFVELDSTSTTLATCDLREVCLDFPGPGE